MIVIFPANRPQTARRADLLLAHCAALDPERADRPSARERLEALLGVELARRLLRLASVYQRRPRP